MSAEDESEEEPIDISSWARSAEKRSCPACGASGALLLGGGIFCPSCGEVSTSPGYAQRKQDE